MNLLQDPEETARSLRGLAQSMVAEGVWPHDSWRAFRMAGVLGWMIPRDYGGTGFSSEAVLAGCIELARTDLVSTFVLSQFQSACTRFVASSRASAGVFSPVRCVTKLVFEKSIDWSAAGERVAK